MKFYIFGGKKFIFNLYFVKKKIWSGFYNILHNYA